MLNKILKKFFFFLTLRFFFNFFKTLSAKKVHLQVSDQKNFFTGILKKLPRFHFQKKWVHIFWGEGGGLQNVTSRKLPDLSVPFCPFFFSFRPLFFHISPFFSHIAPFYRILFFHNSTLLFCDLSYTIRTFLSHFAPFFHITPLFIW